MVRLLSFVIMSWHVSSNCRPSCWILAGKWTDYCLPSIHLRIPFIHSHSQMCTRRALITNIFPCAPDAMLERFRYKMCIYNWCYGRIPILLTSSAIESIFFFLPWVYHLDWEPMPGREATFPDQSNKEVWFASQSDWVNGRNCHQRHPLVSLLIPFPSLFLLVACSCSLSYPYGWFKLPMTFFSSPGSLWNIQCSCSYSPFLLCDCLTPPLGAHSIPWARRI